ncbi:hypothetical protein GCM10007925_22070 [Sphingomonas astaxanthinifaciens DSM 22298]|uniref:TraB/GumN family protein n=1 Tax=Sphingomonas astaxanthinifaciens DSM 22298 TaxID=1123267 RepID=A0ABQ5Z6V0_9SPHN|nr:hypothetical protein GCM10007925_22070 [Sphingomonas astaxanthinifaciens DSM 22298]
MEWKGWVRGTRLCATALASLLLLTGSPSPARAQQAAPDPAAFARPALWVVGDADTTIFLFGTIHTHDGRAHWFDHAVKRAFDSADTLVLETIVPDKLPSVGAPPAGGLAAARATVGEARKLGLSVELGADQVLARAAGVVGKPVLGLESFAQQLDMYRSLPSPARPAATAGPAVTAAPPDPALAPFLQAMVDSWNRGDPSTIAAVVGEVRRQSPQAYQRLFVDRNAAWAQWIERRLRQPGVVFVAVGTGHLVGDDSVQVRLAEAGIRSARVN